MECTVIIHAHHNETTSQAEVCVCLKWLLLQQNLLYQKWYNVSIQFICNGELSGTEIRGVRL